MHALIRHFALTTVSALFIVGASVSHGKTATEVYEQASASTVIVKNTDTLAKKKSSGSGVVLSDGQVLTNCHVIKNATVLTVHTLHKEYPATLQYSDWARDLCSLAVAGLDAPNALLGQSTTLKVGAKVYALGTPRGLAFTFSDGIVSGFRDRKNGRHIQTTAAISRGSSGGGLFDEHGALVGLTTFYMANGQNLNFAIPIEWVSELAQRSTPDPALNSAPSVTSSASKVSPVSPWQSTSQELEANSDWAALLAHSEQWTRAESDSDDAWKSRGIALYRTGQTDLSVEAWKKAVRINPDDADVWFLMGAAYTRASRSALAIEAFQHALSLEPQDAVAWYSLGEHYRQTGQRSEVRNVYKQLKKLDPARAEQFFSQVVLP
jgi:hypothetical protein